MKNSFLKKCAKKYGTPIYIYDVNKISLALSDLKKSLPDFANLFYSIKANPNKDIIKHLYKKNCKIEVSSIGELKKSIKSGVKATNILFTGPGKTKEELIFIIKNNIGLISIESIDEYVYVKNLSKKLNKKINCLIRVNPKIENINSSIQMMSTSSQFGIDSEIIIKNFKQFTKNNFCKIIGFHFYIASNIFNYKDLFRMFANCIEISKILEKKLNIDIEILNLGGGFGCYQGKNKKKPNYKKLKPLLTKFIMSSYSPQSLKKINFYFESGRYLVGTCGGLISKVIQHKISKNKKYAILDSGINHLSGMSSIGKIPRLNPDYRIINRSKSKKKEEISIVGPLCTPMDFWNKSIYFNKIKVDDLIYVPNVSSYGLSASLVMFLSHNLPKEIILNKSKVLNICEYKINSKKF